MADSIMRRLLSTIEEEDSADLTDNVSSLPFSSNNSISMYSHTPDSCSELEFTAQSQNQESCNTACSTQFDNDYGDSAKSLNFEEDDNQKLIPSQTKPANNDDTDTDEEFEEDTSTTLMGRNYHTFLKKLQDGILEAPKLNLNEVPDSIFEYEPALTIIHMRDNCIEDLPERFFERLPSLAWLDLRYNRLRRLPAFETEHYSLRVMLLQGNDLRCLPYSLALATNLKSLGLSSNPIIDPPLEIKENGVEAILAYCRKKYTKRLPIGLSGRKPSVSADLIKDADDETNIKQLEHDLKRTAKKGTYGKRNSEPSVTSKQKMRNKNSKHYEYNSRNASEDGDRVAKEIEKMKYTWGLWNRIPYEGPSNHEIMQKALEEVQKQVQAKLKAQQDAILQRFKNHQALRDWQHETRRLQMQGKRFGKPYSGLETPFGTSSNAEMHLNENQRLLRPEEFQSELAACWEKLTNFSANPVPLSNSKQALQRLDEVQKIQQKLMNMRISAKPI